MVGCLLGQPSTIFTARNRIDEPTLRFSKILLRLDENRTAEGFVVLDGPDSSLASSTASFLASRKDHPYNSSHYIRTTRLLLSVGAWIVVM
jgi:hypothetical protein